MSLPSASVRRPVTTLMVFFSILLIGGVCLFMLPVDLLPEMELPAITVVTPYEGASPREVETKVTKELEEALATVPNLKHIVSRSREGMSLITLTFEWGANIDARSNDVRDAVSMVKFKLPEDIQDPRIFRLDFSRFPILVYGFAAKESYADLEQTLKDIIADPLKNVDGVGATPVYISARRQVNVWLDRERLASYSLTPQDVVRAISLQNQTLPAGDIKIGSTNYLIRVPGEFTDANEIPEVVLTSINGRVIRVRDVAEVDDSFKEPAQYVTVNGDPGAIVIIQKQSGANTVKVANAIQKKLPELTRNLPSDVRIVKLFDQSEMIMWMVQDMKQSLWMGGLLAVVVVLVFLRRVRGTFVIALTIPFSLIIGIIGVFFLNYTINMMTLFAMIIAVGMVVDNAIVILENITRHREEGERPKEASAYGAMEVGTAVAASTLTTICVFFPILFVKGITRILFTQFAVMVSIILVGSLFAALTLTPMLASQIMGRTRDANRRWLFRLSERAFDFIIGLYGDTLGWALRNRWAVVLLSLAIFISGLALIPLLGTEFMPDEDGGFLRGTVHLSVGTRIERTHEVMRMIEKILREEFEKELGPGKVIALNTMCGQSRAGIGMSGEEGQHIGTFMVKLVRKEERSRTVKELAAILRRRLQAISGLVNIQKFQVSGTDPMAGMVLGGEMPVTVNILGEDMDATDDIARQVSELFGRTAGTADVSISRVKGRPELVMDVDQQKASAMGLNISAVADTIRAGFYGREATKFRARRTEYDIFARFKEDHRASIEDLLATPIRLPNGRTIRADNIAGIQVELGPLEIERKDKSRVVNVGCNISGRSLGEVTADIRNGLAGIDVPRGVEMRLAGQVQDKEEAFFWIILALCVAFLLVYMVMAAQFESLLDPFIVMFSVPFALAGTLWALFLFGYSIGIVTLIGILLLVGIVVNNAIVLVDYTNILRARGRSLREAIVEAGRARFRPVMMTALTTISALIPMAFTSGQSSETWNPLGISILGGLLVSTLVTLILVPTLYSIFHRSERGRKAGRAGSAASAHPEVEV